MLSPKTIAVIQSTVPVLEQYGTAITSRFYEMLFTNHPELLNLFNHANQKQGRQQTALANAVYAAAKHIDKLESILPVVRQIAHKHRSLGVLPEHYPIVGQHLLAAIRDVLGSAATDEILDAWAEAYGVIADVFIGVERGMYDEAEHQPGGWAGFRPFRVERKVKESDAITSFYLTAADGGGLAPFEPGQYVSVKMTIPGQDYTHIRQYSLSDAPGKPYYRLSVKREDSGADSKDGIVSLYLHDQIQEGNTLLLSAPAGDFTLDLNDTRPLVLISGGVGLTPMLSMLHAVAERQPQRRIVFIHAARTGRVHAMRQEVETAAERSSQISVHWCYSDPDKEDRASCAFDRQGWIDAQWLASIVPDRNASFYFCGPMPFMRTVLASLRALNVAEADIRYEFFGPAGSLEQTPVPSGA